jgi:outer membrane protein assembly factor BamB
MLAKRLTRRGLALSVAALVVLLAQHIASARAPLPAVTATLNAASFVAAGQGVAATVISAKAITLADGVLKCMLLAKLKKVSALLIALAILGTGAVAVHQQIRVEKTPSPAQRAAETASLEENGPWPQWRGPNRDGVVHGVTVPEKWPETLTQEWRVPVGEGVASPVVVGRDVYVFTRHKNDEAVSCLDLTTGKGNWSSEPYEALYKVGPGEGDAGNRPRSTPAVAGGRIFSLGMSGILTCLDTKTGKLIWRKDTKQAYYGGSSPLVVDDLCIAHLGDGKTGGLTAFDVATGEVKWCFSDSYCAMSGSPILVDLAGERQVVSYSAWNACGVSLATGRKLW